MWIRQLLETICLKQRFNRDVMWNISSLGILGCSGILINSVIIYSSGAGSLGIFNQVFALYIICSQVAVFGIHFSVLKHCSCVKDSLPECAKIVSAAFLMVAGLSFVVCLLLFYFSDLFGVLFKSQSVVTGLQLAIPGLFFFSLNKVFLMFINGLRHMRAFAVFQGLRYVLILISILAIIYFDEPGEYLSLALTSAEFLLALTLLCYIHINVLPLQFFFGPGTCEYFKHHFFFGVKGFMSGVMIEINTRVDVLMIGFFLTDSIVGVYSFAAIIAEGFGQLNTVIRNNVDPVIGKCFADSDLKRISEIAGKIRRTFYPIMILTGIILILMYPLILKIMDPIPEMWTSWKVFFILITGIVMTCGFRPFISIFLLGSRPGVFSLIIAGTVAANILMNLFLIPPLGIIGAAISTTLTFLLEAVAITLLAKKLLGVNLY